MWIVGLHNLAINQSISQIFFSIKINIINIEIMINIIVVIIIIIIISILLHSFYCPGK